MRILGSLGLGNTYKHIICSSWSRILRIGRLLTCDMCLIIQVRFVSLELIKEDMMAGQVEGPGWVELDLVVEEPWLFKWSVEHSMQPVVAVAYE